MEALAFEATVFVVLACLVLGLLLLLVEIVLVPGVGVPGVAGTALILAGVAYAFWSGGLGWGLLAVGCSTAILGLGLRALGFTLGSRVLLGDELTSPPTTVEQLLGHRGVALTTLRPTGLARIDGRRVDCSSRSEWIEAGTSVVVTSVDGTRALVERERKAS